MKFLQRKFVPVVFWVVGCVLIYNALDIGFVRGLLMLVGLTCLVVCHEIEYRHDNPR